MRDPIDVYVGERLRARRILVGLSQEQVAERLGVTFQQIQKYERGSNRVAASRLFELSKVLDVSVAHFFEGLEQENQATEEETHELSEALSRRETMEMIRAYCAIPDQEIRQDIRTMLSMIAKSRGNIAA